MCRWGLIPHLLEGQMLTKLDVINTMLSCADHMPINTLEEMQDSFTYTALSILNEEVKTFQAEGWNFNTERNFTLTPDTTGVIKIPDNIYSVKFPQRCTYVIRDGKIYNKVLHTFKIEKPLKCDVVYVHPFEELPPAAQLYIQMAASYKFTKRVLGTQTNCIYTQEDLIKARAAFIQDELNTGNYNYNTYRIEGRVRDSI